MVENTKDGNERLDAKLADCRFDIARAIDESQREREILLSLSGSGKVSNTNPLHFDRKIIDGMNKWDKIKFFYKQYKGEIEKDWLMREHGGVRKSQSWSDYDMNQFGFYFDEQLSPPEEIAWGLIRLYGMFMLPQFPVRGYFVDFANPFLKIAIEIDGEQWHQDAEKDIIRQRRIESDGWGFRRFSAVDTMMSKEEAFENEFGISFEEGEMLPKNEFTEMRHSLRFKNFEFFCWWERDVNALTKENSWMISF